MFSVQDRGNSLNPRLRMFLPKTHAETTIQIKTSKSMTVLLRIDMTKNKNAAIIHKTIGRIGAFSLKTIHNRENIITIPINIIEKG
jgi:hypothetical protein